MSYSPMVDRRTNKLLDVLERNKQGDNDIVDVSTPLGQWSHDVTGELTFGDAYHMASRA